MNNHSYINELKQLADHLVKNTEVFGMEETEALCVDGWFTVPQLIRFAEKVLELLKGE